MSVRDVATPSPAAAARRAQVVAATIDVVAAEGYPAATFARIGARAGLSSTRLISYHFVDKADLMAAVVADVVDRMGRSVGARMAAASSAREALASYISGVVAFVDEERASMTALLEIVLAGGLATDRVAEGSGDGRDLGSAGHVEDILRRGVAAGDFRPMDVPVVAVAVQRAVEGLPFLLRSEPDLDCAAFGRELVTVFDLATRAASGGGGAQ